MTEEFPPYAFIQFRFSPKNNSSKDLCSFGKLVVPHMDLAEINISELNNKFLVYNCNKLVLQSYEVLQLL
jgi:hypothetical protein